MAAKYCFAGFYKLPLTAFLKDMDADLTSRVYATYILYYKKAYKRRATSTTRPNRPPRRLRIDAPIPIYPLPSPRSSIYRSQAPLRPCAPLPQIYIVYNMTPKPAPPPLDPISIRKAGFLPMDQWQLIQSFNSSMRTI